MKIYFEKIKITLFLFLLALLPFNFRHIFNFDQIKNIEGFRENISYSLYAFDIVFILLLIFLLASILIDLFYREKPLPKFRLVFFLPFFLIIIIFIFSFLSNRPAVSFYNSARLTEAVLFFLMAKNIFKKNGAWQKSILIIFLSGIFQSVLAVIQFILQRSIGLKFFGESVLSPDLFDVAKFELYGGKIIRAYGTFPHPNLLGAFLLLSLTCGIYLISIAKNRKLKILNTVTSVLIVIGIIFTYSRSVWLATFLFLITFFIFTFSQNEKLRNSLKNKFLNFKFYQIVAATVVVIAVLLFISPRFCFTHCPGDQSSALRKIYSQKAFELIRANPLTGVGPGNFTSFFTPCNCACGPKPWEIQPVHNLYLLIASEIGLFGLAVFLLVLASNFELKIKELFTKLQNYKIKNLKKDTTHVSSNSSIFTILFVSFLFLAFFDHYFWTLPQGQLIFWLSLVLAISPGFSKIEKRDC